VFVPHLPSKSKGGRGGDRCEIAEFPESVQKSLALQTERSGLSLPSTILILERRGPRHSKLVLGLFDSCSVPIVSLFFDLRGAS